jgi:hypothetical protein
MGFFSLLPQPLSVAIASGDRNRRLLGRHERLGERIYRAEPFKIGHRLKTRGEVRAEVDQLQSGQGFLQLRPKWFGIRIQQGGGARFRGGRCRPKREWLFLGWAMALDEHILDKKTE